MMTKVEVLISNYGSNISKIDEQKIKNFNKLINFDTPLLVANVSKLGDTELFFFVGFYLRQLYKNQKNSNNKLYNLIFDEAHI
ncbi:hypothetical protein [Spiroplasma endosymbiont of Stenodema calcarata]|uniref:hypothetical protein n=1 Tax=Spiroplasma endosymbiont of Stenodema calcarata TaxID=3139328 RepID=UPI003CCB1F81